MLSNDTWFMYADGFGKSTFLNAAGKTPAELDADKAAQQQQDSDSQDTKNLKLIEAQCKSVKVTKYCQKHPTMSLCTGRVNKCIKQKMKIQGNATDLDSDKATADEMQKALASVDDDDTGSKKGSGLGDDSGDDNTMIYVIGGIGILAVAGIVGFMMYKKMHPAVAVA